MNNFWAENNVSILLIIFSDLTIPGHASQFWVLLCSYSCTHTKFEPNLRSRNDIMALFRNPTI